MKTDNEKYIRRGQALIICDGSERHIEAVRDQFGDSEPNLVKWLPDGERIKATKRSGRSGSGYGKRRIVEIVFSAFKRMFGERLYSEME